MRLESLLEERISETRGRNKHVIAVPMANNEEIIRSIADVINLDLARFRLIGDEKTIRRTAAACRVSIDGAEFIPSEDDVAACNLAAQLAASGEADIVMKGLVETADFIRAILHHGRGLHDEGQLLSHVALLDIPAYHKLLLITDAAINVEPSLEQKLLMIRNAVRVARSIGILKPKIACVAPAERPSPRVPSTMDAEEIRLRFEAGELRRIVGEGEIGGPFGLDVAISREAATIKGIKSPVAGDSDILVMPNLDSANALYKSLTHFADTHAAAIVAGAHVPIVLTSRSDTEQNKFYSVLLALAGAGAIALTT